jgi:hypothetical protein
MSRLIVLVLGMLAVAAPALGAASGRIRLAVVPSTVAPGGAIRVLGNAGDCPRGDTVIAISRAFPGRQFGAAGALTGRVGRGGAFSIRGRVRSRVARGRYVVTARCGGGNLGVAAYVRIS